MAKPSIGILGRLRRAGQALTWATPRGAKARYEAAKITRRTSGWITSSAGPNAVIATDLAMLRERHRHLAENNPWIRRAIAALVTNTIGPGIRAQWPDPERQARWSAWWETTACDADGRHTGYGLQGLAFRSLIESGECLIRRRPRHPEDGLPVPLQIQILESDFLDSAKTEALPNGNQIVQGVEFSPWGQRVAYWLFTAHPGETTASLTDPNARRYPASEILHLYRVDRPGQVRGVPWGTGAMLRARMLDDYQDAQLERQRLAACYMAFVRGDPDYLTATSDEDETALLDKLQPGAIEILPDGKDISFASPPQPEDDRQFQLAILRSVAADYGIPYEVLTGDLSEVNFSSARMGWNEFARNIDVWRWQLLEAQFLAPLIGWYRDAEAVAGLSDDGAPVLWTAPSRQMVDESREIEPLIKRIRAGLISLPEAIRKLGYDPLVLAEEQAAYLAVLARLGLNPDSVQRRQSRPPIS